MPTISGTVIDQNSLPLPGVSVRISQDITFNITLTTDVEGKFSRSVPALAPTTTVTFTKADYTFKPQIVYFYHLISTDVKTANSQGFSFTISGTVTDGNGVAIAAANIQIMNGNAYLPSVKTNSSGYCLISGLRGYVNTSISISKTGYSIDPNFYYWSANDFNSDKTFGSVGSSLNISGKITKPDGTPITGLEVQAYQGQNLVSKVNTDTGGNYNLTAIPGKIGTTIYPKNTSYTFVPSYASWTAVEFTSDKTADFVGYSCTVSGYVKKPDLSGLASTKITAVQGSTTSVAYTDQSGFYSLILPGKQATTLSASKTNCTFSPASQSWSSTEFVEDKTQNFSSTCSGLLVISGQVTGGNPSGVTIELLQNNVVTSTTTTNLNGFYSFVDLASGTYSVKPSRVNCTFSPEKSDLQLLLANISSVNFAATCSTTPIAFISADPMYGPAPLIVSFDGSGSSDPAGQTLTYSWTFGDGSTSTEETVEHTYDTNGQYVVTLTVTAGTTQASSQVTILVGMPLRDAVIFKTGPFRGQCFPLLPSPLGTNSTGNYLQFQVPLAYQLSSSFSSNDDQYDIQYFLTDLEDPGIIGEFDPPETSVGSELAMRDRTIADHFLSLSPHLYNGDPVPVANSSIAVAKNYLNANDDGEFVYVAYQALEEGQWRVYLRQIRISEYKKPDVPDPLVPIQGFDVDEPILISDENGNSTNPVVEVDYDNDVFVAYENTGTEGLQQIVLKGTKTPRSFLPAGDNPGRNPDDVLSYFFTTSDFTYTKIVTTTNINQLPDMFVDLNNVVHLTWQSNQNLYWEIYYANSDNDFEPVRITNYKSRSFRPKISGDSLGNLFIVWHDDRFGGWEVLLAYKTDSRTLPWMQQDPYLASARNGGYSHISDTSFPITITNTTSEPLCISKIRIDFYKNRLLEDSQFYLDSTIYPFAFSSPSAQNDTSVQYFDLSAEGTVGEHILAEYDSTLSLSEILSLSLLFTSAGAVEIAFRASDIASDPDASLQWTNYVAVASGSNILYSTLGLETVAGKYKQIKLNVIGAAATFTYCSVTSLAHGRICLAASESTTINVNLTPLVDDVPVPLPLAFENNQTYFVGSTIYDENSVAIIMGDPHLTVSYQADTDNYTSWSESSCTFNFSVSNGTTYLIYYNFIVSFYQDASYTELLRSYTAAYGHADLSRFTVDDSEAADKWDTLGVPILADTTSKIMLAVPLEDLVCDVVYYVKVTSCDTAYGADPCETYTEFSTNTWKCSCASVRWTSEAANLYELSRWKSSAFGSSETRITDTRSLDGSDGITEISNINPTIKLRGNMNGIVMYQSNRVASTPSIYGIYASVFNVVPAYDMYASGAQSITSQGYLLAKMDIPISTSGINPSFDIDPFENIFSAWEQHVAECTDLAKGTATTVNVHRCSLAEADLAFSQKDTVTPAEDLCSKTILEGSFVGDLGFENVVRTFKVKDSSVLYSINYENQPMAVVDHCNITLEVVGTPETVAVRFQNGDESWSEWRPFDPLIGDYTAEFDWTLSSDSGLKKVTMQVATPAGLALSKSILIAADYKAVDYSIRFYGLSNEATFSDADMLVVPFPDENSIFVDEHKLLQPNGYPVAGLRPPSVQNNELVFRTSDYIFIEIEPASDYIATFGIIGSEPSFDVVTQGNSQYNLKTYHAISNGLDVFRGVFKINKEGLSNAKDGFSRIVVNFRSVC